MHNIWALFCKCASVSGIEVHLLHIANYCWKIKSVIAISYTGTQIVYTSAVAALNMTMEKHLKIKF